MNDLKGEHLVVMQDGRIEVPDALRQLWKLQDGDVLAIWQPDYGPFVCVRPAAPMGMSENEVQKQVRQALAHWKDDPVVIRLMARLASVMNALPSNQRYREHFSAPHAIEIVLDAAKEMTALAKSRRGEADWEDRCMLLGDLWSLGAGTLCAVAAVPPLSELVQTYAVETGSVPELEFFQAAARARRRA